MNVRRMVALLAAAGLSAPAGVLAANRDPAGSKTQGTGAGAAAGSAAKAPDKKLVEGLEKLHAGNQAEIQSGKLAQRSATNADVKAFGEKMVTDHTQMDQQLTSMAQAQGVSLEGKEFTKAHKDAQKRMTKLAKKTGADFDKAYVKDMVSDHEKDADDVKDLGERARKDGQTEVATFLDQAEQAMQGHLSAAKQLEDTVKNEKRTAARKSSASGTGSTAAPK
jgi:putative membrane protein